MAKPPFTGSKLTVSEFVHKKLKDKSYKVIQPAVLSFHDDKYWWFAKIVSIGRFDEGVGIARKREAGFVIVSETSKKKLKIETQFLETVVEKKKTSKRLRMLLWQPRLFQNMKVLKNGIKTLKKR